jgi:hypothetical protein
MIRGNDRHCVIKVEFDEPVKVGFFVRVNSLFIEWQYKTGSWKESEHPTGWGGSYPPEFPVLRSRFGCSGRRGD